MAEQSAKRARINLPSYDLGRVTQAREFAELSLRFSDIKMMKGQNSYRLRFTVMYLCTLET